MHRVEMKLIYIIMGLFFATNLEPSSFRTTLNNADPNPFYNAKFPFTPIMEWEKDFLNNRTCLWENQYMYWSVSPFFQQASKGNNQNGNLVETGDLTGRWNMIAVLPYNDPAPGFDDFLTECPNIPDVPTTACKCISTTTLTAIRDNMLNCIKNVFADPDTPGAYLPYPDSLKSVQGLIELQNQVQLLGFFSVPINYKRKGVRFQAGAMLAKGLGVSFDIGVSNVTQTARFIDLTTSTTCLGPETCLSTCPTATQPLIKCLNPFPTATVSPAQWHQIVDCIHINVMNNLKIIAEAAHIDLCDYNKTSLEDVHAELFWRRAFAQNVSRTKNWPRFLFIPFFHLGVTLATGAQKDADQIFSLANGNNGHDEVDLLAGFSLDFADTIEVGTEAGFTHFKCQNFNCYRMPNNLYQNSFYPYQTSVTVKPGDTWHIGVFMNARYFLEHWSFWGQYVYINHNKDRIWLAEADPAFHPERLECKSAWSVQLFNAALNYDISPNFSLGVFAQIPLARQNAYRSSSVLGNFTMTF